MNYQHSGKSGDVICSCAYLRAVGGGNLYLRPTMDWTESDIDALTPLLNAQSYVKAFHYDEHYPDIDLNLDLFRAIAISLDRGHLAKYYSWAFQVNYDLAQPWLVVKPDKTYSDAIVVNRTLRYRNNLIRYRFLQERAYERVVFIGSRSEAIAFRGEVRRAEWIPTPSLLEAAQIIAGSKLYIGNQSACWWIAGALKVKRVLEVYAPAPNSAPHGPNGYDVVYQPHLETLVKELYAAI